MLHFTCPNCNAHLEGPDNKAGKLISCPQCRQRITVPAPESAITVSCPGCGRRIPLKAEELSITIQCSRCDTCFIPAEPASPPQSPASYLGSEHPTTSRTPLIVGVGIGVLVLILCCGVLGFALMQPESGASHNKGKRAATRNEPTAQETAAGAVFLGIGMMLWGLICAFGIAYAVAVILLLGWVAKDARARGIDGGIWVLVILASGGLLGLLVYLVARPAGILTTCPRCLNKRLQMARTCPHCGELATA